MLVVFHLNKMLRVEAGTSNLTFDSFRNFSAVKISQNAHLDVHYSAKASGFKVMVKPESTVMTPSIMHYASQYASLISFYTVIM